MKINNKSISIAFVIILAATVIISLAGMLLMSRQPLVLQGQVEATEIRISGKLPGRVDSFLVQEGDWVKAGDTLVVINSPTIEAKYRQVNALEQVAMYKAAQAAERAAYEQYQMAVDGAQSEDRASARSLVEAARSTVDEVSSLLVDSRLTAPEDGQIATIFPKRGELVAPGTPIMSLVVMDDAHVVLNIREDLMPQFKMGGTFRADVPAIDGKDIEFRIYYISPLGSFATWKSTKQTGSYDMQTFEIHARPTQQVEGLRPGMSVLLKMKNKK